MEPKLFPTSSLQDPKHHPGLPFLLKGLKADLEISHLCPTSLSLPPYMMMRRGSLSRVPCQGPLLSQEHAPLSVDGHTGIQAQIDTHTRQEPHRHPGEGKLHNSEPA